MTSITIHQGSFKLLEHSGTKRLWPSNKNYHLRDWWLWIVCKKWFGETKAIQLYSIWMHDQQSRNTTARMCSRANTSGIST